MTRRQACGGSSSGEARGSEQSPALELVPAAVDVAGDADADADDADADGSAASELPVSLKIK